MVSPAEFIDVAEETGLIQDIGDWVTRTASEQIRVWQEAGLPAIRLAVNVSPRQFWEGDLAGRIGRILASVRLRPETLELEVTEGLVMDDRNDSIETLKRLSAMGIRLLIDDFGTGYSSLSYLRRLPIHALKIDQSFVRDMLNDPDAQAIVSATIVLAHKLGLDVVAEGVETHGQRRLLQRWGCDELQGYLISKPLDADAFTRLLRQHRAQALAEDASRDTRVSLSPKRI
jgi:EAL domain-containing protein (putative c-di-GMP-specific phosphodiesterase class I)